MNTGAGPGVLLVRQSQREVQVERHSQPGQVFGSTRRTQPMATVQQRLQETHKKLVLSPSLTV